MKNSAVALLFVVAELAGILLSHRAKDPARRAILAPLGFGFAVAIVGFDILPDATRDNVLGYLICAAGFLAMMLLNLATGRAGSSTALAGLAFHNLAEGVVLSTASAAISPALVVGAVLHKLPEGVLAFSLLGSLKERTRFAVAGLVALLVPVGAAFPVSERVAQPVMAFSAGVILFVAGRSLLHSLAASRWPAQRSQASSADEMPLGLARLAPAALSGALIGWASCLLA